MYNLIIIDLPFPLVLYKKLLRKGTIDLDDMKSLSPAMHRSLRSILDYQNDDLEDALSVTFTIDREFCGTVRNVELKPGGASIMVTQSNKQEFVELYIDYVFNKSCEKQFQAFSAGFRRVINSRPLELFYPDELLSFVVRHGAIRSSLSTLSPSLLQVGNTSYDWNEFQKKTEYKGEYHANHAVM